MCGILTFIEKLNIEQADDQCFPLATGSFVLWVSIPPKKTTDSTWSFLGKQSVYASKDVPSAPLTIQIDVPVTEKLGPKRLEPIKQNVAISVEIVITGMSQSCISGDLLEYILPDKLARPNATVPRTPRKPRAPLLQEGDDGTITTPSKRQRK